MADTTRERIEPMTGEVLDADDDQMPTVIADTSLVGGQTRAEIDIQIATAHRWRRVISTVKKQIQTLATLDTETAYACTYRKPQRMQDPETKQWFNGFIEGPSARFAEIVMQSWGNCRVAARRTNLTDESVEATGVFHDLESNVAIARSVTRSIMGSEKEGKVAKRFPMHLIETTSNAAASIAMRNAILAAVPKGIWNVGYKAAYAAAKGDQDTLGERRDKMLLAWKELGVAQKVVFEILGVAGKDDITIDVLFDAAGFVTAVRDHETTVEELLATVRENRPAPVLDEAFGKGKGNKAKAAEPAKAAAPVEQKPAADAKTSPPVDGAGKTSVGVTGNASTDQDFAALADKAKGVAGAAGPTETAGAQSAETAPATSESATAASTGSAEETSGQQQQGEGSPAGETVGEEETDEALGEESVIAFNGFSAAVKEKVSWLQLKPLLVAFRETPTFKKAPEGAQQGTLSMVYDRVLELKDPVSPKADALFYELWLYKAPPPEIDDVWSVFIRSKAYEGLEEDEQKRLALLTDAQQS
ncbi:MAG TPA: hypothetical protein VIJ94_15705 [Caulobacteraceae bacterium]